MHYSRSETDHNFYSQRFTLLGYHFVSLSQAWAGVSTQCIVSKTYKFLDTYTYILNKQKERPE